MGETGVYRDYVLHGMSGFARGGVKGVSALNFGSGIYIGQRRRVRKERGREREWDIIHDDLIWIAFKCPRCLAIGFYSM